MMYSNKRTYTIYGVGDIELLNKIIPTACSVGKKAAIGFGEATICIKKADNFSLYKDGEYIRPIPVDYLQDKKMNITDQLISSPIHPPYYGRDCKYYKCCM